jgi:hypothetical protein
MATRAHGIKLPELTHFTLSGVVVGGRVLQAYASPSIAAEMARAMGGHVTSVFGLAPLARRLTGNVLRTADRASSKRGRVRPVAVTAQARPGKAPTDAPLGTLTPTKVAKMKGVTPTAVYQAIKRKGLRSITYLSKESGRQRFAITPEDAADWNPKG